ncbi:hypothetical protein KSP39_PZI007074 [Platanthera zijinensis]|uniref:Uncharacterized protein n=1 Tax=Platanthera zijinensis TaxID=2320716 RepID=A0AAP0BQE6_9ASPA
MEKSRRRSWKFLACAKAMSVDLTLNAAIEHVPPNSTNVRRRFSVLLRVPRVFIAMKLENYESEQIKTYKNPSIIRFFAKVFGRRRMMPPIRANAGSRRISKPSKPRLGFSEVGGILSSLKVNSDTDFFLSRLHHKVLRKDFPILTGRSVAA